MGRRSEQIQRHDFLTVFLITANIPGHRTDPAATGRPWKDPGEITDAEL
jgi:hypothetical protein